MKRYPLVSSSFSSSVWISFTWGGQAIHQVPYNLCSWQINWGLSLTTWVISHTWYIIDTFLWWVFCHGHGVCYLGQLQVTACIETQEGSGREQRKLGKGEILNICQGPSNICLSNLHLISKLSEEHQRNRFHFLCGRLCGLLCGMCCTQLSDNDNQCVKKKCSGMHLMHF